MISRYYEDLGKYLEPNKALVIYGSRQVGKTTLLDKFLSETNYKYKLDSGDNVQVQNILSSQNFNKIIDYASGYEVIAIDEAQRIPSVGLGLKIIIDQVPNIRIIATGSSSFELAGQVGEPLTGRKRTLTLFPVSFLELRKNYNLSELDERLPEHLVFGSYPAVVTAKTKEDKASVLKEIVNSFLLKDILELEKVKGSKVLFDLLRLVAYQVGSEVSLTELGTQLGIDYKTVGRYLDLLEKAFVLYNLRGFSRNLRKEITKKSKYYFYDNGVRNSIISNYNDLEIRNDQGQLWVNFLVAERLKVQEYKRIWANNYFWRTWEHKEVDWVEEREGKLFGYEFKYSSKKKRLPKTFLESYPDSELQIISPQNYRDFLALKR